MVLDTTIIGNEDEVRRQIGVWEAAGVTMLLVSVADTEQMGKLAPLVGT